MEAQLADKDPAIQLPHQRTFGTAGLFGLGLGWMMNTQSGQDYLYHDGNSKIGFNTICTIYPKQRLGIVIIVNEVSSQQRVGDLENRLYQLIK
ncbi:serine hydrolase [Pedobacter miscanthi]|uniref:serine hydrolase n=1 Tax=Pedobacter miscanthi TaxID=2259170 RepID=UPI002931088A|nr:serine hydrolase [Pedobacter miscanthi]